MNSITIKDNSPFEITPEQKELLKKIANKSVNDLKENNPDFFLFPDSLGKEIQNKHILTLSEGKLHTHNIAGFIGIEKDDKKLSIFIISRFDREDKQFFLQYMLHKVFSIYLFNWQAEANKEKVWEFLLYSIFLGLLKKALAKGIYKEYVLNHYNDSKVKGTIDIPRFIKQDIPFMGNIAYNVRERSFNNRITQLIRHTIEHILSTNFHSLLRINYENIRTINLFREITPDYSIRQRQEIIRQNRKPVIHPYFTEYELIRKIALQILTHQRLAYEPKGKLKVYGILFDVAWLWEEYIYTLLQPPGFEHPKNIEKTGRQYLFEEINKSHRETYAHIYPDFYYKKNDKALVLDTKYKPLYRDEKISQDDLYQIITYIHILKAEKGVFVYPKQDASASGYERIGKLNGYGGEVGKYGFPIPTYNENEDATFRYFSNRIKESENNFTKYLKSQL